MQNTAGFEIKLKKIRKYQPAARVEVVLVLPDDIRNSYNAFLGRERKMNDSTFVTTHLKARRSVATLLRDFSEVTIKFSFSCQVSSTDTQLVFNDVVIEAPRADVANELDESAERLQEQLVSMGVMVK
jgi:hypothetical protein